ncbi:MAG: gliding motility-associated C-terminal domain-containing protein, partial [Bacteroidota bacterium]|nr:gliding motility-associated C-terminal domain-containing protein [Bacteroidota bacterium]
ITTTFAQIGPLCQNSTAPILPTSSTNTPAITGTWSPATINTAATGTTTYTFTPGVGQCASTTTMNIVITNSITPTFTQIGPLCQNSTAPALPTSSTNTLAITGTWSPATINTAATGTTTYTFTPTGSVCASTAMMNIVITTQVIPAFAQIGPLCQNSTALPLPAISANGVSGNWSPATISTATIGTTTYTFTPSGAGCATTVTMSIVITTQVTSAFTQTGPLCQNSPAPALPTTSINGVSGIWNPATISTATVGTTTYTFTPSGGGCATTAMMNIVITTQVTPTFTQIGPLCQNSTAPLLPTTSTNNITGTWSPATINTSATGTTNYIFTPATGQCAASFTMSIVVTAPAPAVRYPTITTLPNIPVQLNARNIGVSYLWTPPAGLNSATIINPVFNYNLQTEYTIKITTSGGCITTDTFLIKMPVQLPPPTGSNILVPKAWSPNGDGHNDKLITFTVNIKELRYFRIFNRWGQLVFETNTIGQGWDGMFKGQLQGIDTYQWIAEGIGNDGQVVKRAGNSVLIR